MEPTVNYFHRTELKPKSKKKYPVCVYARFNAKNRNYVIGLDLTVEEYKASQKKNPEGQASVHLLQISTAHARIKAIALIMEPYIPDFLSYVVKRAAKGCEDIFINSERGFDAYTIASQYLEEFKKLSPGAVIPTLLKPTEDRALVPLNAYAQNVQANLMPSVYQTPVVLQPQPTTSDGNAILVDGQEIPNAKGGNTQILIHNTYIIHGNGSGGGNGQILLPDSHFKYNPDANLLTWIMGSMDKQNKKGTFTSYKNAVNKLAIYAKKKNLLTSVDGKDHLAFRSVDKDLFETFEKWLLRESITLKSGEVKGMKINSVKTYISYIKSAFELAVLEGIILAKENPFGKQKYIIPKGEKQDRSLTPEEWECILKCDAKAKLRKYKDKRGISQTELLAMLEICYRLSGINLVDISKMRCHQIKNFHLKFTRKKMERKKGLGKVDLEIVPDARKLFAIWGTPIDEKTGSITAKDPDDLVFPILTPVFPPKKIDEMTEEEKEAWEKDEHDKYATQLATYGARANRFIRKILTKAGFDSTGVSVYSIRHTFTNDARKAGMDVDKVMKRLGQSSYEAFSHYNNRTEQETEDKVNGMINNFKKVG